MVHVKLSIGNTRETDKQNFRGAGFGVHLAHIIITQSWMRLLARYTGRGDR